MKKKNKFYNENIPPFTAAPPDRYLCNIFTGRTVIREQIIPTQHVPGGDVYLRFGIKNNLHVPTHTGRFYA